MTQLNRERAELKSFITGFLTDPAHDNQSITSMTTKVFRIALTALGTEAQEPVAYMYRDNLHADARFSLEPRFGNWSPEDINEYEITETKLYVAPQPVAVPDELNTRTAEAVMNEHLSWKDYGDAEVFCIAWNACRAAMLNAEPVSQPYKLVGEVVAWNHPTKERRVDFRWINFDVLPGTKLYAMPPETPQEPTK